MNRLSQETSPYLLQHAHNPVDWYPWSTAAFEKAVAEDKPILVSIGYSTCHWCHVMERESFEDESIAALMNEHFVNIKVDREERPDVDQIYMDAVQTLTKSGGWPLNCFLTPDKKPFFGGTYFPPKPKHGRPSWKEVLEHIAKGFKEEREEVEAQANKLVEYIQDHDEEFISDIKTLTTENIFNTNQLEELYTQIQDRFDQKDGGFGHAPKFPSAMSLQFLLNYHFYTKNETALSHAIFSLNKMIQGGIYDQIGGGFARYATDKKWLIPHFEKMLYDNALLIGTIANAYKITKADIYKETLIETLDFIEKEMTSEEGGFYSAQDADSEGVEGKYYVWSKKEIEQILGKDAEWFCDFCGVTAKGNWEEQNILWREVTFEAYAEKNGLELMDFKTQYHNCRKKLYVNRNQRIKPGLDDKILLDWNALMTTGYAKAYAALGNLKYKEAAERNISFIYKAFQQSKKKGLFHTYKNGQAQYDAFLSDYAYLIEALLETYFITFKEEYLHQADELVVYTIKNFYDPTAYLFFYTNAHQTDIIIRKKEWYDNATPSGNSTMVHNLQRLGVLLEKEDYQDMARKMLQTMKDSLFKYPTSFSRWGSAYLQEIYGIKEVAIVGKTAYEYAKTINEWFVPNKVIMATEKKQSNFPLLADKSVLQDTMVYVCENYACQQPTNDLQKTKKLLI